MTSRFSAPYRVPETSFNLIIFGVIPTKIDIKYMVWKPTFDVVVSDCAFKFFVFGTGIHKNNQKVQWPYTMPTFYQLFIIVLLSG